MYTSEQANLKIPFVKIRTCLRRVHYGFLCGVQPRDTCDGGLLHALVIVVQMHVKSRVEMFVLQEAIQTVLSDCSNRVIVNKTKSIDITMLINI